MDAKVQSIVNIPVARTKRFLPLSSLLCGSISSVWSAGGQVVFKAVKLLLNSAPVLSAPEKPFKLEVDASGTGAGAVLLILFIYFI